MAFNSMKAQIEKKNDLIKRAESIVNLAETEKRELTPDEAQELAEIRDDVRKIKGMLEAMAEIDDARACGKLEKKEDAGAEPEAEAKPDDAQRELTEKRSFEAYIRGQVLETRDTNLTETANGAVIPVTIAKKIIAKVYDICPILEKSTKYSLKGDLEIPYYDESSTAITVAWATEFVDLTSNVGSFTSITLKDYLAGALTLISRKLINNSEFDLTAFIIDRMALAIARFIEGACLNGGNPDASTHVNQVKGLAGSIADSQKVYAGSTSAIDADKVIELKDSVKDVFQNDAMFIMSRNTRTALRLLKDDVGRYLLQDDITSPFGSTLLGKPIYVSDNMPEIASGVNAIYYGDMRGLATKFSEDMNIQVLREKYATMHAVGVVGWVSFDAKIENAQAISALVMSVSA